MIAVDFLKISSKIILKNKKDIWFTSELKSQRKVSVTNSKTLLKCVTEHKKQIHLYLYTKTYYQKTLVYFTSQC